MLDESEVDVAFAQSDWRIAAHEGVTLVAEDGAMPELRSVIAL